MAREENAIQELNRLADQLEAIANWQEDNVQSNTPTAKLLRASAKWHRETAMRTCGQGFIGCRGGDECDSEHK